MKKTQKQTQYNVTTGKKFPVPENYNGINTPYFSAGDYTKTERPTPAALGDLAQKFICVKERSLLEFLGQKVVLYLERVQPLNILKKEQNADGTTNEYYEKEYFFVAKFPGGRKEYFFKFNQIIFETLHANGLINGAVETSPAVAQYQPTLQELVDATGHNVTGYFYYTAENGGGKKLFADLESVEKYHNAIQARFENSFESESDQAPQDQEKAN